MAARNAPGVYYSIPAAGRCRTYSSFPVDAVPIPITDGRDAHFDCQGARCPSLAISDSPGRKTGSGRQWARCPFRLLVGAMPTQSRAALPWIPGRQECNGCTAYPWLSGVQRLHCSPLAARSAPGAQPSPTIRAMMLTRSRAGLHCAPRPPGPRRPPPRRATNQMCNHCAALSPIVAAYQVEAACPDSPRPVSQTDNSTMG